MKEPKFLEYDEWLKENKKALKKELDEDEWKCVVCEGAKQCTCDCGHTHKCGGCKGDGHRFREIYEERKRDEMARWKNWHSQKEESSEKPETSESL